MSTEDFTPKLGLPYLLPNQAQKHVTLNESLRALDSLVMASVEAVGESAPPAAPVDGQAWITGAAPTGAWSDHPQQLAAYRDGAWFFYLPQPGWRVWDLGDAAFKVFDGADWADIAADFQNIDYLGLGTTADANNPFSLRLNSALVTALEAQAGGSGDVRLTLNKEAGANVGSILMQTSWSGRAELGLVGDEAFRLRVSDDGAVWRDALIAEPEAGRIGIGTDPGAIDQLTVSGRMRVTSDQGHFLLRDDGALDMARYSGGGIFLRTRSQGSSLNFGVTDSAGVLTNTALSIRPDSADILAEFAIAPAQTDTLSLGSASRVWRDVFLTNSPTVSSDIRGKHSVTDLTDAEHLVDYLRPVSFYREGDERQHFGFVAQDVRTVLQTLGLENAALWRLADPDDGESGQALCQEELIAVLVSAVQKLQARVDVLEQGVSGARVS